MKTQLILARAEEKNAILNPNTAQNKEVEIYIFRYTKHIQHHWMVREIYRRHMLFKSSVNGTHSHLTCQIKTSLNKEIDLRTSTVLLNHSYIYIYASDFDVWYILPINVFY